MSFTEMLYDPSWRDELICAAAQDFVHGAVACSEIIDSSSGEYTSVWCRPQRFLENQLHALGSCLAWHPGLFKNLAKTSAGVCLEFTTNSSEIALELRTPGLTHMLQDLIGPEHAHDETFDGVACEVDGELLPLSWGDPVEQRQPAPQDERVLHSAYGSYLEHIVCFSLVDAAKLPAKGVLPLPGFGNTHQVRLWLPTLHQIELRNIWGDGTYIKPCDERPALLVVGDEDAQGVLTGDPAGIWPVHVAERLSLDLINQSLARQVFQPSALAGLERLTNVAAVVINLGDTYRKERCRLREVSREIRQFFTQAARLWSDIPVWVVVPSTDGDTACEGSCYLEAIPLIELYATRFGFSCITPEELSQITLHD